MTKAEFGSIDVGVNNADYLLDEALIKDARLDNWWAASEANMKGGFISTQAFVKHASLGAMLISMVTALAHSAYYPGFFSYGASKIATLMVMQDVHEEPPKYRVFSIQTGIIDTVTSSRSKISEQDTDKYVLLCSRRAILCPNADVCLLCSRSPGRFLRVAGQYRIQFRPQESSVRNLGCG